MHPDCPLCRAEFDDRRFRALVYRDHHDPDPKTGALVIDWDGVRDVLARRHGIEISKERVRDHADYHLTTASV